MHRTETRLHHEQAASFQGRSESFMNKGAKTLIKGIKKRRPLPQTGPALPYWVTLRGFLLGLSLCQEGDLALTACESELCATRGGSGTESGT